MKNVNAPALGILLLASLAAACGTDTTIAPSTTSSTTLAFSSAVVPGGASSRAFVVSKAGTLTVTLSSAGAATTIVGLGLGIPNPSGTGCNLTTAVTTTPGANPQLTASVDAGAYCVRIYDVGTLTDSVGFAITIVRP